jgi:hypothetical protein
MTKQEAMTILDEAPYDDLPCKINKSLTRKIAVDLVRAYVKEAPEVGNIPPLMEKRVLQVSQDRRRPA